MKLTLSLVLTVFITVSQAAHSETVSVKYFGTVNLSDLNCTNTISSFMNRICYDPQISLAIVQLKSTYYAYCGIPSEVIYSWLNASSKGRFYNNRVKGRYRC